MALQKHLRDCIHKYLLNHIFLGRNIVIVYICRETEKQMWNSSGKTLYQPLCYSLLPHSFFWQLAYSSLNREGIAWTWGTINGSYSYILIQLLSLKKRQFFQHVWKRIRLIHYLPQCMEWKDKFLSKKSRSPKTSQYTSTLWG